MNIQHFSSLADILIDTEALTLDNPLSTAQYDEESFEQESHSNLPSSGVYHYDDDHERYDEEDVGREGDNNSQYYDNTFEETGGTYLSSYDHERVNERTALKVKEDHDDNEEEDNHYENTFENEYSKSYVGQNTPCPSIENILTTSTPSPKTLHSNVLFGGMSGIKATENIKTFEDLAIMSTPSNSNQSSPRGADSFDHEPTSTQPPPKMKIHVLPPSSEATRQKHTVSNIVPRSEIPEKIISSTPKLFSKVQFISKEEIEKESKKGQGERRRKMSGINNQQLKSSSKNIEPWNITSEDLDTMKKAKAILDRIESQQKELQDQQAHRMVPIVLSNFTFIGRS